MSNIINDKRKIASLRLEQGTKYVVNASGPTVFNPVTEIEPYYENGEMANVVWFKIWHGDHVVERINGKYVVNLAYMEDNRGAIKP